MKFKLLNREFDVDWIHMILVFGVMLCLSTIITLAAMIYSSIAVKSAVIGHTDFTGLARLNAFAVFILWSLKIFSIIGLPLLAFLFLWTSFRLFKFPKDIALCRSLSLSYFIVFGIGMTILSIPIISYTGYFSKLDQIELGAKLADIVLNTPLNMGFAAVMLYLWLLVVLKPEKDKLVRSAELAGIFAFGMFVLEALFSFFLNYPSGNITAVGPVLDALLVLAASFALSLPVFYSFPKKLKNEAFLFSGLYLAPVLISAILLFAQDALGSPSTSYASNTIIPSLQILGKRILDLGLIYLLATWKRK